MRFDYRSHDGTPTRRDVEPHSLVNLGRRWYLVALGPRPRGLADVPRRPSPRPAATGARFAPRRLPTDDAAAYVQRSIAARATATRRGSSSMPREDLDRRVPPSYGSLEPIDEPRLLLTGSDWLGGLAVYIAELGVDFTVVEPPELAERVRELAGRFARAGAG